MNVKRCPKCNHISHLDPFLGKYRCDYCEWIGENVDNFKENDELLDEFINELCGCIRRGYIGENKENLRELLLKLLNSL